jgi:hypothetical protein
MVTDEMLHDLIATQIENAIRDQIDTVLARAAFNIGPLPDHATIVNVIESVMQQLGELPGSHWLPDDMVQ